MLWYGQPGTTQLKGRRSRTGRPPLLPHRVNSSLENGSRSFTWTNDHTYQMWFFWRRLVPRSTSASSSKVPVQLGETLPFWAPTHSKKHVTNYIAPLFDPKMFQGTGEVSERNMLSTLTSRVYSRGSLPVPRFWKRRCGSTY